MSTGGPITRSRARSSNMAEQHEELRQIISQALAPIHEELKALPRKAVTEEMINNAVKKLEEKLVAQDGKINLLQNRIATLVKQVKKKVKVKKIEKLEERVDDCEQYSRRLCVRIDNMAVPSGVKEDCLSKIVELMSEMDSNLSEDSIDRAHRIGPKIVSENGTVRQQMIVRFKTFSDHTKFYRSGKKAKKVSIRLDLTKKRLTLLNVARGKIKDREGVDFAFADINCNLALRLSSGDFSFFRTEPELDSILQKI